MEWHVYSRKFRLLNVAKWPDSVLRQRLNTTQTVLLAAGSCPIGERLIPLQIANERQLSGITHDRPVLAESSPRRTAATQTGR
jgi:hypothetical protein